MSALWNRNLLDGHDRKDAIQVIVKNHYTHSFPSGKTRVYRFGVAIVALSIPANAYISRWLLNQDNAVWELSRLWAPDEHEPNLLTQAISATIREFRLDEPSVAALVSYADPNAGHKGGVYRAASWQYLGQTEETRMYQSGSIVKPRRAFHSGNSSMTKAQIEAAGYSQVSREGKHRFAFGLTKHAKRAISAKAGQTLAL